MKNIIIPINKTPIIDIFYETRNDSQYINLVFEKINSFIDMLEKLQKKYSKDIFFSQPYYNTQELMNVSFGKNQESRYLKTNNFSFTDNKKETVLFFNDDYDDSNAICFIKDKIKNDTYLINQKSLFGNNYYNINSINIVKNDNKIYSCGGLKGNTFFLKENVDLSKTKYIFGSNYHLNTDFFLTDTQVLNKKNTNISMIKAVYFHDKSGYQFKLKNTQYDSITIVDNNIVELKFNAKVFALIEKSEQLKKNKTLELKEKYAIIKKPKEKELELFNNRIKQALEFNSLVNDKNKIKIKTFSDLMLDCAKHENKKLVPLSNTSVSNILQIKNNFIFKDDITSIFDEDFPGLEIINFENSFKEETIHFSAIANQIHSALSSIFEE